MSENVFYTAVEAHIKWKIRLQRHLDGTSKEHLDPNVICLDDQCVLGKWIYGDGKKFQEMPAFEELRCTHADFHKCASEVVRKTDEGNKEQAESLFRNDYMLLSKDITRMLVKMNAHLKDLRK
ncbi:CZB domain-containing protein [Kaarinaea lacus]